MRPWRNPHTGRRRMLPADNVGATCDCLECRAAGVTHLRRVRVPDEWADGRPRWLHGDELRAWHAARDRALAELHTRLHR